MKNLIIMIAIFLAASVCYSQTFNAPIPKTSTLKTTVITPFSVRDFTEFTTPHLPDVIMGQVRTLPHNANQDVVCLFEMNKETNYTVYFSNLSVTETSSEGNLKITAHWMWHDELPTNLQDLIGYPLNQSGARWNNPVEQTKAWASIHVEKIDASQATSTGVKVFTATCTGYYEGL
jgi:hypothetical protein